jgi:SAM-dependent methyltransferase
MSTDYEYRGMMARYWDALRGDTSSWPDRGFFRSCVDRFYQPVLDVGCSGGRLLVDFAQQGIDIDGVDVSPEMVAICRRRLGEAGISGPQVWEMAMDEFDLPRRYRLVMVPSGTIQLLLDPGTARRVVQRLVHHLEPGGALVITLVQLGPDTSGGFTQEAQLPDGSLVRRTARWWFDPATGLERTEDRYELVRHGEVVESDLHQRDPATRAYGPAEVGRWMEEAGLTGVVTVDDDCTPTDRLPAKLVGVLPEGLR